MGILKADRDYFLSSIPEGSGSLLDIGGGQAPFKAYLERKGYIYVNLDIDPSRSKLNICGDAHNLPFKNETFKVVISVHSLEHFVEPSKVISEVQRVLKNNGFFIALVPFLAAFHGQDDFWRYTPSGIRRLLDGFQIQELKATTHICANIGDFISTFLWRMKLHSLSGFVRNVSSMLDKLLNAVGLTFESHAHTYLIVARKDDDII